MTTPTEAPKEKKSFYIEYEVPPLRAIYNVYADNCDSEETAIELLRSSKSVPVVIRKITEWKEPTV